MNKFEKNKGAKNSIGIGYKGQAYKIKNNLPRGNIFVYKSNISLVCLRKSGIETIKYLKELNFYEFSNDISKYEIMLCDSLIYELSQKEIDTMDIKYSYVIKVLKSRYTNHTDSIIFDKEAIKFLNEISDVK